MSNLFLGSTQLLLGGGSCRILGYGSWGTHTSAESFTAPAMGKTSLVIGECGKFTTTGSSSMLTTVPFIIKGDGSFLCTNYSSGYNCSTTITVENNSISSSVSSNDINNNTGSGYFSYIVYEIDA